MDQSQRLNELETAKDWPALATALEEAIAGEEDSEARAALFFRLGHVLADKLLQGARALKHFQNAWKLRPADVEPLLRARAIYWELGKFKMVETVLRRSLEVAPTGPVKNQILFELGQINCDLGHRDAAADAFGAIAEDASHADEAQDYLVDLQQTEASFRERVDGLLGAAAEATSHEERARFLVRAARVAAPFDGATYEELLLAAYQANADDAQAASLFEEYMVAEGRLAEVLDTQRKMLESASAETGPGLAFRYGVRWTTRHQNVELGARLLEQAVIGDPTNDAAFTFLRELWGTAGGDWERVAGLCDQIAEVTPEPPTPVMAEAGRLCWRELGDLMRARRWFERLAAREPEHPQVVAFERQIGESLAPPGAPSAGPSPTSGENEAAAGDEAGTGVPAASADSSADSSAGASSEAASSAGTPTAEQEEEEEEELVTQRPPAGDDVVADDDGDEEDGPPTASPPDEDEPGPASQPDDEVPVEAGAASAPGSPASSPPSSSPPSSAPGDGPSVPPAEQDDALIAELLADAEKQQAARRNHDYVKTLVKLGEAYVGTADKVRSFAEAAEVYQKFSNASEASKCFERVLELDADHEPAKTFLRGYYEKRRDWDSLVKLMRREADAHGDPELRLAAYVEIAQLATEKIKKPAVCIELWADVRRLEPQNVEALGALATLYERARDFEPLAEVLQEQALTQFEDQDRLKTLEKLAQIQGDRLKNDEAAADAWRQVLEIQPGDRRAQENLKKRLLALRRWDDLELLYEDSGKWDEFIRLLESQEAREKDPETKVSMLLKAADLWQTKKNKADRAARAYEKVLKIDGAHLGAAEALIPIYEEGNNPKGLAEAIEVKLGHLEGEAALPWLQQVAGLYETRLRKPDRALARFVDALTLAPELPQTSEDVERVAQATGSWAEAVTAYRAALDAQIDPATESMLRLKLGRVLLDETEEVDGALEQYRAVYELEPDNTDALQALERLYRQTERFTELLEVYGKQRDLVTDPDGQRRVLYGIAELYERELGDVDNAIQTYLQVLDVEPADERGLEALDGLYQKREAWEPYADILRRRLELDADEARLIDLKYRLGQTLQQHLGDAEGALENYREILLIDANDDRARVALEGLLDHESLAPEVARILSQVYEGRDEWDKFISATETLVQHETDDIERVSLLRKVAMVAAEQLDDPARAFEAQARALRAMPESDEVRLELEDFAERGQAWSKLGAVYREVAQEMTVPDLARSYWMRLAGIQRHLEAVDDAAESYRQVLELDPADAEALDAMEQLFASTERWQDLVGVIRRRIELADDFAQRERFYANMASIYDERLNQPEEAIAAYNEVLSVDDASMTALRALDDLYSRQKMYEPLSENLEQQLRLAETEDDEIALMLRLAALQETELDLIPAAIDSYRQVLERDPQNANAIGALERLGQREDQEVEIADILGPLYRQAGDYEKLLAVYEVQVRRTDDASRAVELLHEMAELHEDAGGNLDAAFDTLARALALDPGAQMTQEGLERLANATDRFADLARVYEELAGTVEDDTELAISLCTISARIYEFQLGVVDQAVGHYRRILQLDPAHLASVEALERIFQGSDRFEELSAVLQQRAELLGDFDAQKQALMGAARIEEDVLQRVDNAVAVYQKVLEIDAEDLAALDALIKLYLGQEKWSELLEVQSRKADLVYDAEERKRIYYQMGAVYEEQLQDLPKAMDVYQRVLEIDPDDLTALGRLDVLYERGENWPELLTVLQQEADLAATPEASISFQYRIAELYDQKLDDVERAIELYRDVLTQMSDHEPTLTALDTLMKGDRAPLEAARVLEPIYDALSAWPKLIEVLEVQAAATEDPYQKVDLLARIAGLYEEMVGDPQSAFDVWARAAAADMTNDTTLAQFERLASVVERWSDLAQLYDAQLEPLQADPVRHGEIGLRVARIYEEQLENFDTAIERYTLVLEQDPENAVAIASLDRLYAFTERYEALAGILAQEAELAGTTDEQLEFKFRLAQVKQFRLDDVAGAIEAYGDVLVERPDHAGALQALEALFAEGTMQPQVARVLEPHYEGLGQFDQLASVYEAALAHTSEPESRLQQYYRLVELHEERLMAPDAALSVFIRALQEYPSDERTLDDVERLAQLVDDGWEHLANAYADALGAHTDVEVQKSIGKRLARVFEEELGDVEKADETYRYVLTVAPLDVECLENLDRIYSAMEQHAELAGVLEQRVQTVEEPYALVELHMRLGELYHEQLGQLDDAVRIYRRVFDELEPENEPAQVALETIYAAQQKWQDLYGLYDRQLDANPDEFEQANISAKKARVLSEHLGDTGRAIDVWRRVLELRGEDSEALTALSELYERTEQWAELTEILERHMATVVDDGEQVQVLLRRARLFLQHLGRDDAALDDYNRVLDIDYENLEALYAINEISRARGDETELLFALHQTIDRAGVNLPAEHLVALYREAAMLHQQHEEQRYEAIDAWRKLLETDPRDFDAMAHLEELLRAEERWEEVVDVKMMRARAYEDAGEQLREYGEVAHIWEHQIGRHDGAVTALDAMLELDPASDDAFEQLEKLHRASERWEPLIDLYLTRIENVAEVDDQTKLLRKVAKVSDEKVGDQEQAYESLMTAFELNFHDEATVAFLEKITAATKKWAELINVVNGWLEGATDKHIQITLSLRLAKWYGDDLDRQDYAMPYYQKVQALDPNNVGVLRQMANFFKRNADWRKQGTYLENALKVASKEVDRAAILNDLGEVFEKHVDPKENSEQGLAYFKRAVEADPHYVPALENLERIYEGKGQQAELVETLLAKSKGLADEDDAADVKLRAGGLLESVLGQPERAIEVYRDVLDVQAGNLLAIKGLERVYQVTEKWPELLEVLEMHLDVVQTERERAEVLMQIASLQETHFFKADLAAQRLEQVVAIDPTNEPAFEMLARCYHRLRQWLDLVQTLERHIQATDDRAKKVELYTAIADTYAEQVEDQERALDAYLAITDLDENHVPALEALSRLYERMDDPSNAIDYMTRVADLTVDGGQRVDAFYRIGKQLEEKLGDRYQARERFEMALDLDPTHVPTLAALRAIAVDESDWDMAARYLDLEQQNTELPRARAKLLIELGRLRDEMLDEKEAAVEAWALAHQADPDNEEAALPLARHYVTAEQWGEAEPLTAMLVDRATKREREEQFALFMMHGDVEAKLEKWPDALQAYAAANRLDLTNQEAIRGLADVNFALGDWAGALTNYQKVLTSLGEDDVEARADIYFRLGCVKREQAQGKQAINNFEKGLALDPTHRPTLEALVAIYDKAGDFAAACNYRQQILDNVMDGEERYGLLLDLGDTWSDRVGDPQQALYAYESASELKPDDHPLMHKMLPLYQKTNQWDRMVEVLQRIAEGDPKPDRRARYLFTMGQIYRDKLEEPYSAADLFDEALDLNPGYLDAFKRIDKLYTQLKDWGKLERAYRKMIHRVVGKGNPDLEYNLWHALGLIYRDRIGDTEKAVEAFSAATAIKPDATKDHHILAELAEHQGRHDDAVASYRMLLQKDPGNIEAYRAIYNVFLTKQAYDEAWCAASVLALLKRANEEEQRFFDDWKPQDIPRPSGVLDDRAWQTHLFHRDEDQRIGKIFEAIGYAALKAKIKNLKQPPVLPDQFRQDAKTSTVQFARTFFWARQVLGLRVEPLLYARSDQPGGLDAVPNDPPASIAGQGVLQGLGPLESAFVAGKHLAMYRGEHYIKQLFPTQTELTVLLFAAIRLVAPNTPAPPEYQAQVQATAEMLAPFLQAMQREALKVEVNRFLKEGARANIKRWAQAVETTSARTGLLLAGDLEIARRAVAAARQIPGDISPQERIKDLMLFAVSEDHFALRRQLGLQIQPEAG
ncbi:MAG: tetratricopeptide repeat protein [Myxococcota bacterium]